MRVIGVIEATDNLCDYCLLKIPTCPKATHIKFGNGKGNDNVIECSECATSNNVECELKPELGIFKRGDK